MFRNHLRLIFRRFTTKPLYPSIAIMGLVIGFSATLLVILWLADEFSYDQYNTNSGRVYRLTVEIEDKQTGFHWDFARSQLGWLKNISRDIPGIESMVRIGRWRSGIIRYGEKMGSEELYTADPSVIKIFSLQFVSGEDASSLSGPEQVIISESLAKKYFGQEDPLDKTLFLYCSMCSEQKPYRVTGVYRDFPSNSHVHFHVLASYPKPDEDLEWAYYYVMLNKKTYPEQVLSQFPAFAKKYANDNQIATYTPHLQKMKDIHLKSAKDREFEKNGSIVQVKLISALALFVLFITFFNFFNLKYVFLLKEHKPFKVFRFTGASNSSIVFFQGVESFLYGLFAALISLLIVWVCFPYFNALMGKQYDLEIRALLQIALISVPALIILATISGLVPLLLLRARGFMNSLTRFPGNSTALFKPDNRSAVMKSLVGTQYIASFLLIIAVIVLNGQTQLFMESSLGKSREKLICLQKLPVQVADRYQILKEELLSNPLISGVTSSMENPGDEIRDMMAFQTTGVDADLSDNLLYVSPVDDNFFDFYDIPIIAGNNFPKFTGDNSVTESYILNEKAVRYLGWEPEEAVGKPFRLQNQYVTGTMGRIVGVVRDFQPSSMREAIRPYVYFQKSFWLFSSQVRYDTSRTAESLEFIKDTWHAIYPEYPLDYEFVDNLYKEIYKGEFQLKRISILLCILALILSAAGLFGITGITYEARTKEIGIRKVNGAGILKIIRWLLRDILIIVAVSLAIAVPLSIYLVSVWLENYAYRISPGFWNYIIAGSILLGVALITVSWQTWRAAIKNPVTALRYE